MANFSIVTLSGSPSLTSRSSAVLAYARHFLAQNYGLESAAISVRDFEPADLLFARTDSPAIQQAIETVAQAQAVIIASPVYKAAYSGALKTLLDLLPQSALAGKSILPVATGGSAAHTLVLDYAFKPVLAALGAQQILSGIFILDSQLQVEANGQIKLEAEATRRLHSGLESLTARLSQPVAVR